MGNSTVTPEWVEFWPVYWRTLLGLPWDWRYVCVPGDGHREVACEHDFPKLSVPDVELLQAVLDGRPIHQTDRRTGGEARCTAGERESLRRFPISAGSVV